MKMTPIAALLVFALCGAVQAQDRAVDIIQRDAGQQQRIAEGLRTGQISVREAGRLEQMAQRIQQAQANALGDDSRLDRRELGRIAAEQNNLGAQIRGGRHDGKNADPNEVSARRMAEAVQRSADQQKRIARGITSGELSAREAARLERGQARVSGMLADATGDGYVGGAELASIQNVQERMSGRVFARRHDRDNNDRY
jgi:hypothetical protein